MTKITFEFIRPVEKVQPQPGRVYLDVGDELTPGIIDHHQENGMDLCAAELVLRHPEIVRNQIIKGADGQELTIILHSAPDLDAVSAAFFAKSIARQEQLPAAASVWASYVGTIDRGLTRLNPQKPVTPYSLFMARMWLIRQQHPKNGDLAILKSGLEFLALILPQLEKGYSLNQGDWLKDEPIFAGEVAWLSEDYERYCKDRLRMEITKATLPKTDGNGTHTVPGLWISQPDSALFKSWCRGDALHAGQEPGFVFTGVQLSPTRHILSVTPDSDVLLKGLGELLEQYETAKRKESGKIRKGTNRPGYYSPDPWYDGRSPLHNYTIVDSPRCGTVLSPEEVRYVFEEYSSQSTIS